MKLSLKTLNLILIFLLSVSIPAVFSEFHNRPGVLFIIKMDVKTPSGIITNIQNCTSPTPNFACQIKYHDTSETGWYTGRAITFLRDESGIESILSADPPDQSFKNLYFINPPKVGNLTFYGFPEYLNVFWEAYYPDNIQNEIAVSCWFNCDPRKDSFCSANCEIDEEKCFSSQKCEPFPFIQLPGKGSCSVVNPNYNLYSDNKIICRIYDPTGNQKLDTWY